MNSRKIVLSIFPVLLCLAANTAFAEDQITALVSGATGPTPVVDYSGSTIGTNGVVHVWYTTDHVPCGAFSTLSVALADIAGSSKGVATTYPEQLTLAESGSEPVQLSATQPSTISGTSWVDSSTVTVSVDCSNIDTTKSQTLAGHLNVSATPTNGHLSSISGIEVVIKANVGSVPCLNPSSIVTNQDTGAPVTSLTVVSQKGNVKSTNPGQVSADALVANTCGSAQSFDVAIGLPSGWQTNPNNNPGNATFEYTTSGLIDPSTVNVVALSQKVGTPQGEAVCLSNISLADNSTFLATVHSQLANGTAVSSLANPFNFTVSLYPAGTGCVANPPSPTGSDVWAVSW